MEPVFFHPVQCPYCGEPLELAVDGSAGGQVYIEDCSVCCRPMEVRLSTDGGTWHIEVQRDDD